MKKITLVFLLSMSFIFNINAQLSEDFEGGTTIPAGWASFIGTNGLGTVENWQINDGTTNNLAFVTWEAVTGGNAEDWLVTPQFTVDATNFILSFDQSDSFATDYGSTYTVRVSTMTQTTHADFTIIDTQNETDVWSGGPLAQHTVDLTAYIGQAIYVAFVLEQNDGDRWLLDNINMIANATAPDPVTTPDPVDMAIDIFIDPTDGADADTDPDNSVAFSWVAAATGDAATAYDFYLGDSEITLNLLGSLGDTSVNITGMEYSTEYFWTIVAKNVGGEAIGSQIWSFTTQADPSLSVEENEQNIFTHYYNKDTKVLNLESSGAPIDNVEIYSILGQKAFSRKLSETLETIDVAKLNTGIYIAKVNINGNFKTIKFIKN